MAIYLCAKDRAESCCEGAGQVVASKGREQGVRGGVEAEGCHQEAQTESGGSCGHKEVSGQ